MPLEPEWVEAARQMRADGATYRAIGKIVGHDHSVVRSWLNEGVRERRRVYAQKWSARNPEMKILGMARAVAHRKKYAPPDITVAKLALLRKRHSGLCDCCGERLATHLDHCHQTGKVRGLVCNHCNRGIGFLGDSLHGVSKAAKYLQKSLQ